MYNDISNTYWYIKLLFNCHEITKLEHSWNSYRSVVLMRKLMDVKRNYSNWSFIYVELQVNEQRTYKFIQEELVAMFYGLTSIHFLSKRILSGISKKHPIRIMRLHEKYKSKRWGWAQKISGISHLRLQWLYQITWTKSNFKKVPFEKLIGSHANDSFYLEIKVFFKKKRRIVEGDGSSIDVALI